MYRALITLKKSKRVLGNGEFGARMIQVPNTAMDKIFSFVRHNDQEKVFVIINFSSESVDVSFSEPLFEGHYFDWQGNDEVVFDNTSVRAILPWQYEIWVG